MVAQDVAIVIETLKLIIYLPGVCCTLWIVSDHLLLSDRTKVSSVGHGPVQVEVEIDVVQLHLFQSLLAGR